MLGLLVFVGVLVAVLSAKRRFGRLESRISALEALARDAMAAAPPRPVRRLRRAAPRRGGG